MEKVYFYGFGKSYEDGEVYTFFRHYEVITSADKKIEADEWACLQDFYIISCTKLENMSRKEAAKVFHEFDREFQTNGYKEAPNIFRDLFKGIIANNGNIQRAIASLQ